MERFMQIAFINETDCDESRLSNVILTFTQISLIPSCTSVYNKNRYILFNLSPKTTMSCT